MSGRIRSIKPEILEDTVTAGLSDMAHRIFIGIITLCEDSGRFRAEPGWLMGQIYWKRPVDVVAFAAAIDELVAARLIVLYEASGQRYGVVRSWEKHQRISHRAPPRLPAPPWVEGEAPDTLVRASGGSPEVLGPDLRSPIPIPIPTPTSPPTPTPEPVAPPDGGVVAELWEHYVAVLARHRPRRKPGSMTPKDRKRVRDLLRTHTVEDLKAACNGLFKSPHHLGMNDRSTEYLEFEYALRKPTAMMALADEGEPPADTPAPVLSPEAMVDPGIIDAFLAEHGMGAS